MNGLWVGLCPEGKPRQAHDGPHEAEVFHPWGLGPRIHAEVKPHSPPEDALRGEAMCEQQV